MEAHVLACLLARSLGDWLADRCVRAQMSYSLNSLLGGPEGMGPELITVEYFLAVFGYRHFSKEDKEVAHRLGCGLLVPVRFQCKT